MPPLELAPSPPPAPLPRLRDTADYNQTLPPVQEMNRLIADIRRARALLDAVGEFGKPVTLEHVLGNDPRD